mmetsp:Transcript_33982/g.25070  ORF Transcript_33982/g.25070 Transcript_33982/m.25070 type:complete len:194 (-) Transcript_33982:12-593(-)
MTMTITNNIVAGQWYRFRVRAKNLHGWGSYSSEASIQAATAPDQMSTVTTSVDSTTGKVKIAWSAPDSNSATITEYLIEIQNKAATTWTEQATYCDGASSTIKAQMYCLIPMSTLTSSPYLYTFQDVVIVRASAKNAYGFGATSTPNSSGAQIRQIPDEMPTPTLVSKTETEAEISWSALTSPANGDSAITEY